VGDLWNDGRISAVITNLNALPSLLVNQVRSPNHWIAIRTVGTKSNRDGIGAVVRVTAGGETQTQMLRSGSSYLSSSELILTFGLAQNNKADTIEIRWPGGQVDHLSNVQAGKTITATEGKGETASRPYAK